MSRDYRFYLDEQLLNVLAAEGADGGQTA